MPKSKNFKAYNQALAIGFQAKKNWANSTFLWAANRDSAKVVEKSVKSAQKCNKTGQNSKNSYHGLGISIKIEQGAEPKFGLKKS